MSQSFELWPTHLPQTQPSTKQRVAITGASGRIGHAFLDYAANRYLFRLLVHPQENAEHLARKGEIWHCDISTREGLEEAFHNVDTVVHLAADPAPDAPWDSLLPNNITGTRNVFDAANAAQCKKVVYASSIHAVSGYPVEHQVHPDEPVNPGDLYGVSKCFGEAMARYMAMQHNLASIVIRIGAFQPVEKACNPEILNLMNTFAAKEDIAQLIVRSVDDTRLRFAILHGLSNNLFNRMDITQTQALVGYEPEADFTEINRELSQLHLREKVQPHSLTNDR